MKKKLLFTGICLLLKWSVGFSQDSTAKLDLSGSVDGYYRYSFSDNGTNNFTSFTNSHNSFELGMASLRADASALKGKVTATADLGFGRRAEEFSYNDGTADAGKNGFFSLANIKQVYITYSPTSKLKLTAGKFSTHVGYELLDAYLNRNYSMSYMFTNGPFFHTGVKADYTAGPLGLMLGLANYTDQSTATNNVKTLIGQVSGGSSNGSFKAYLNYVGSYGSNTLAIPGSLKSLSQYDLVLTEKVNNKFNLALNATYQQRDNGLTNGGWLGAALYLNYDASASNGITFRSEFIADEKLIYFTSKNIFANTLSLVHKVGPLLLIPELRYEVAESPIYKKNDGSTSTAAFSALIAAVYKF